VTGQRVLLSRITFHASLALSLRELEALARALLAVLLAFLSSRVASNQACFLESHAEIRIHHHKRARNPVPNSACLSGDATAVNAHYHVNFIDRVRQLKRLPDYHPVRFILEIIFNLALIDGYLAGSGP
jgi:hypothetical protein